MAALLSLIAWLAVCRADEAKDVPLSNAGFEDGWWDAPADPAGKVSGRVAKG